MWLQFINLVWNVLSLTRECRVLSTVCSNPTFRSALEHVGPAGIHEHFHISFYWINHILGFPKMEKLLCRHIISWVKMPYWPIVVETQLMFHVSGWTIQRFWSKGQKVMTLWMCGCHKPVIPVVTFHLPLKTQIVRRISQVLLLDLDSFRLDWVL